MLDERARRVSEQVAELEQAFLEIQVPRTEYMLRHFVVGQHDTAPQQYAQCVLEMQIKYDNIRRAMLTKRKIQLKIDRLEKRGTEGAKIEADLKRIDLEEQDRAMLGALREFDSLYAIWKSFPKQYTRGEMDEAQEEYWVRRLSRQAHQDMLAGGRVGQGNQEALRQIGRPVMPQLSHVQEVEKRYLETGDVKVLAVVATEKKAVDGLPCVDGIVVPSGVQIKYYNVFGREVSAAYNHAAQVACDDGADFMMTVEDDTFPPPNALLKLLDLYRNETGKRVVGGWYPKRSAVREGAPIVVRDGFRQALDADGGVHEAYTIPMGCTLFPVRVFADTEFPWFVTTDHLTQDSFFSQKAREAGYRLLVDTSLRCKHVDRKTGEVFE
jgi:hypothetical protein